MIIRDPRKLPGDITGPGGPHDRGMNIIDASNAVLLDNIMVASITEGRDEAVYAMLMEGRINRTRDRARVLFVFDADGIAAVLTELTALLGREGNPQVGTALDLVMERWAKLREAENTTP